MSSNQQPRTSATTQTTERHQQRLRTERERLLATIEGALHGPMALLGIIWVTLLILDLSATVPEPWATWLGVSQVVIWAIFGVQFLFEFFVAPSKVSYLRRNWLTAIAVVLPAFRVLAVFRIFRLVRVVRGLSLLRIVTSVNRGIRSFGRIAGVAAFPYVVGASTIVVFAAAAGMSYFERDSPSGLGAFGEALWWSAAMLTTIGSENWPQTLEGRLLGLGMMVYSVAVFGYITATLASYFVRRNSQRERKAETRRAPPALEQEMRALRREMEELRAALGQEPPSNGT